LRRPRKGIDLENDLLIGPDAPDIIVVDAEGELKQVGPDDRNDKRTVADIVSCSDFLFFNAAGHRGKDLRLGQFLNRQIPSRHSPFHIPPGNGNTGDDIVKLLFGDQFLFVKGLLALMLLLHVGQGRLRLPQYGRRLLTGKLVVRLLDLGNDLTVGH
jgi:hypothetical protein